jgi:hypothetical protein
MHLIAPLISGIRGCENGWAEIYKRGTSTRATVYGDYDGSGPDATGANVVLDANGGSEVYVDEVVDVVAKSSAGTTIRAFVDGPAASNIEVISKAFTGTDYATAESGVSKPAVLEAILDKWIDQNGGADWQVKVNGVTDVIPDFLAQVLGMVYNVKDPAYGAKGDDVADDTSAIQAACTAAAATGGIVFFPAGIYRISAQITVGLDASWVGCGPNPAGSVIRMTHASAHWIVPDVAGASEWEQFFVGLRFIASTANTGQVFRLTDPKIHVIGCQIGDGVNVHGTLVANNGSSSGRAVFSSCRFRLVLSSQKAVSTGGFEIILDNNCDFDLPATYSSQVVDASKLRIDNCTFGNGSVTSGTFQDIQVETGGSAWITDCKFPNANGGTATAIDLNGVSDAVYESGNLFGSTVVRYDIATGTDNELLIADTRAVDGANLQNNDAAVTIDSHLFGFVRLEKTSGAAVTCNLDTKALLHQRFTLEVWNNGTGGNVTVTVGGPVKVTGTFVVGDNEIMAIEFVGAISAAGTVVWVQCGTPVAVPE